MFCEQNLFSRDSRKVHLRQLIISPKFFLGNTVVGAQIPKISKSDGIPNSSDAQLFSSGQSAQR